VAYTRAFHRLGDVAPVELCNASFMSGLVEGKVVRRKQWAPGLVTLSIDAQVRPFAPGQFFNIGLVGAEEDVRRAYSAASAPGAPELEFYLNEVPGGALTPRLCSLVENQRVLVDANPQGFFTLGWVPAARELWMVATGTGLGPFISMLRSGEASARFERIVVVHGVRHVRELGYRDELSALQDSQAGQLMYVPVVSRETTASACLGRVTTALQAGELEKRANLTLAPERSHVMLCGNPAMIDDMLELLAARGLRRHRTRKPGQVTVERYWESPET
jgi:ferredoxin/flavodoxin---NADP+ reductase